MWKETLKVRAFGWLRIPMIAFVRPRVVELDSDHVVMAIPLTRRSRNHLGSMYFGALSVGADLAAGYLVLDALRRSGRRASFVFQAVQGNFLRRPDGRVHFRCDDGAAIAALVERAAGTKERQALDVRVVCTVPSESSADVARFTMTLSVKVQ